MRPNQEWVASPHGHDQARHIARDTNTRGKFRIVGVSEETGLVELRQQKDGWARQFEEFQRMPWTEFIQGLMDGRFEIHPLKQPVDYN